MRSGERQVRGDTLFAIDVTAELRNLSKLQLQGSWQVPAELVRRALQRGAAGAEIRFRGRGFVLRCTEQVFDPGELHDLAVAVDAARSASSRHQALVRLEEAGAQCLLWTVGLEGAKVRVTTRDNAHSCSLLVGAGAQPRLLKERVHPEAAATELEVRGGALDARRAAAWLESAARFAPAPVTIDGRLVEPRFPSGLFRLRIQRPLPGLLSVAAAGDVPRLWLLQHGVVATRATVPGYPAFQAAVELGGVVPSPAPPAALREAVTPFLRELIDRAIALLVRLGHRASEHPTDVRQRVATLLLLAASQGLRRSDILDLPLVPVVDGNDTEMRWWSSNAIRDAAAASSGAIPALTPDQDPARHSLAGRPAVVLSTAERGLLSDLVGVRFEQPVRLRRRHSLVRMADAFRSAVRSGVERLRGGRRGRVLAAHELSAREQVFLAELHRAAGPGAPPTFAMCTGSGPARRIGERILLPRRNRDVELCVAVTETDRAWLYPVLLVLLNADSNPPAELRQQWLGASTL